MEFTKGAAVVVNNKVVYLLSYRSRAKHEYQVKDNSARQRRGREGLQVHKQGERGIEDIAYIIAEVVVGELPELGGNACKKGKLDKVSILEHV
jgi:hypothetical protein